MRFQALATDYDGTLATGGAVGEQTFAALVRFREGGRKVLMVTGREMPDLMKVCPRLDMFDLIVAENGALLFDPATQKETLLAAAPTKEFVELLQQRKVTPMSLGRVIVATWQPHETTVLQTIRDLGLELQVIFNKGAVMILPPGVNKATGLAAALKQMNLSPQNVVAVGDAENDHALCRYCGASGAVANALPALKEAVTIRLQNHHGAGVEELIEMVLRDDLASVVSPLSVAAECDKTPQLCFYFRGPEQKLNLRAQNLRVFAQLGEGVDDATWEYHLRRGDYSRWFGDVIGARELAAETARVEREHFAADESRRQVLNLIERHLTEASVDGVASGSTSGAATGNGAVLLRGTEVPL
jgi:HAD superfamily hydrolase (TIGR01484 family)